MASETRQRARLCLTVAADDGAAARERLSAALAATDIASVIVAAAAGRALEAASVQPLVALAQKAGAAVLIADDARLARTLKADGVHMSSSPRLDTDYETAREILGRGGIVGGDAGRSRHDAMVLGEAGADYVGFGVPAAVKEQDKARARRRELIGWWAEIFEPPCMALDVTSREEAAALAAAGADFIAVALPEAMAIADVRAVLLDYADAIGGRALHPGGAG